MATTCQCTYTSPSFSPSQRLPLLPLLLACVVNVNAFAPHLEVTRTSASFRGEDKREKTPEDRGTGRTRASVSPPRLVFFSSCFFFSASFLMGIARVTRTAEVLCARRPQYIHLKKTPQRYTQSLQEPQACTPSVFEQISVCTSLRFRACAYCEDTSTYTKVLVSTPET